MQCLVNFFLFLSPEMIVLVTRACVFLTEEHASEEWFAHLQSAPRWLHSTPDSPTASLHPPPTNIAPILVGQQAEPRGVGLCPSEV